ncbi:hypothetical protein BH09ACT3_BH09ACT3_05870 [soil metagenome]
MNRPLTALFSALEAVLVAAIGLAIPLVPLSILWAFQYDLQIDWIVFWRVAADSWLLGSGADLLVALDPTIAASLALPGAETPFVLTIAALGFALITVLFAVRAGRRIAETAHRTIGTVAAIVVFAAIAFGVTVSALYPGARPSIWQGTLLPTLVFALGLGIGAESGRSRPAGPLAAWAKREPEWWAVARAGLRGGVTATAILTAASALLLAVLLLGNYARIISLYEAAHAGVLGGIALTVGQLAFLPNLVIWAASWLVGPGFAIGTGSSVSPLGTSLGPIPAVPVLGVLPEGDLSWGFLGLLVPVIAGFAAGLAVRPGLVRALGARRPGRWMLGAGLGVGVVGGVLIGLLAWVSAGSAGPGRLAEVGPSPWLVGGIAAVEFGVAATVALFAGRPNRSTG